MSAEHTWNSPQENNHAQQPLVDYQLVRALQRQVADRLTDLRQHSGRAELTADDERQLTLTLISDTVSAHNQALMDSGQELPDPAVDAQLARAVESAIFGAGALQPLLDDEDIENIDINGSRVWVTYADSRGKVLLDPVADSDEDLITLISTLAAYHGINARPFTPATPELDLRLADGSRLSAIMTASPRPAISIRRHRIRDIYLAEIPPPPSPARGRRTRSPLTPDLGAGPPAQTLLQLGTVDEQLAVFLRAAVLSRANILIAGATDSGKTTLLRALIHCIPSHERLITVERALELGIDGHRLHPDVLELEEVLSGPDGGGVNIRRLVARSRRMNPSRVIVGEVMGPEVVEMLTAMHQGNNGSLSTLHSRSAEDVFDRLATYAAQYENFPFPVTHALIGASVDLVLFMAKHQGRRIVTEVLEVTGSSDGTVTRAHLFTAGADGRASRQGDVAIRRAQALAEHGYDDSQWEPHWAPGTRHPPSGWEPPDSEPRRRSRRNGDRP